MIKKAFTIYWFCKMGNNSKNCEHYIILSFTLSFHLTILVYMKQNFLTKLCSTFNCTLCIIFSVYCSKFLFFSHYLNINLFILKSCIVCIIIYWM